MTPNRLQAWVDRHFFEAVPILALIGCARWTYEPLTVFSVLLVLLPAICGAFGCYFWALYLRKRGPGWWFLLGLLLPGAPQLYLLGWHRGMLRARRRTAPPPTDCPRCGTRLGADSKCPNCRWNPAEV